MDMTPFIKSPNAEGKEKHVPFIQIGKDCQNAAMDIVRVIVGKEVPHPNTPEHHIEWIDLYGELKSNGQVLHLGRASWAAVHSNPNVRFQINKPGDFSKFHALAYCNLHGVWGSTLAV